MLDVNEKILEIIKTRRGHLPEVQRELERWQILDAEISQLDAAVQELRNHPHTPGELKKGLEDFQVSDLRKGIADAFALLRIIETRFSRGTINIGVSGRARVGKSTLLQAISGLTDQQIPTGKSIPVTAVRSRIQHSTSHARATLMLHSFDTFREGVLRPYHAELGLAGVPISIEEFRQWPYTAPAAVLPDSPREKPGSVAMLQRLQEMQQSLWSYETLMTGRELIVELKDLRQYVAYPTDEELSKHGAKCPRPYLAVRDVRIECKFPRAQVEKLCIIDLPGLGEIAANAEQAHIQGLKNEVDFVIQLLRPEGDQSAYWGDKEQGVEELLDNAREFILRRGDFQFIVINKGSCKDEHVTALKNYIKNYVNEGEDDKHIRVLETDALNIDSVNDKVLSPILQHLAERLPNMDGEVFKGTRESYIALNSRIQNILKDVEERLAIVSAGGDSTAEELDQKTVTLRKDLAESLGRLVEDLRAKADSGEEDPDYITAVDRAYEDIDGWIEAGYGMKGGREAWCKEAVRTKTQDKVGSIFAANELNHIRVEISQRYSSIDAFFKTRLDWLLGQTANIFRQHLGELLDEYTEESNGYDVLRDFANLLAGSSAPCLVLSGAVNDLLSLRLDYRTHLHPRVRRELNGLKLEKDNPVRNLENIN